MSKNIKLFYHGKDGGPESYVEGFWLIEIKSLFSIALLKFSNGSRDSFHSHAFNSLSWVLKGKLIEFPLEGKEFYGIVYRPSLKPIKTLRSTFHKVISKGTSWVFTIRGPWDKSWKEYDPKNEIYIMLTNGRLKVTHGE